MAATVLVRELNGAGETPTDKSSGTVFFRNNDSAATDNLSPLIIPTVGQEYSYRKVLRLHISAGPFTEVSNLRVYTDSANGLGTGVKVWHAFTGTYTQPAVPTEANDPPQFPGATPMTNFFTLTSGAPGDIDAINTGPFDSSGLPKDIGDYVNLVMEVETTASQGVTPVETVTFAYDEI